MTQAVADALQAIADLHDGNLTPELVVQAAKSEGSPLHPYFTWNVKKAAAERWLQQARTLIYSVRVEISTTNFAVDVPAYVRNPSSAGGEQGYVSLGRLRTDSDMAREAVVNEFARASNALARAKAIAAALGMDDEIDEVRASVGRLTERAQQTAV